jgi:3-dehydroquinate dehydratase II
MKKILIIHGPNLHLLGTREPGVYGKTTLAQINARLRKIAAAAKARLTVFQSNHEGQIVDSICASRGVFDGIVINPAAYTHTSVAIRDAIAACGVACVEVHLSNIYSREQFRQKSLMSPVCRGTIMGFGPASYYLGLQALMDLIE